MRSPTSARGPRTPSTIPTRPGWRPRRCAAGGVDRAILVCGSGAGVAVAACKFPEIRAVVAHDTYTAHQSVEHDDCNILCLGGRVIGPALAADIIKAYLAATFTGEDRHKRRLAKIDGIEREFLRDDI